MIAKNSIFKLLLLIVCLFLLAIPLLMNFKALFYNCLNISDFGIYQQAIYEIASGASWNPFVTVRDIHIFNEHFDPIIYLAVPFVWISNYSPYSLLVFEWLWYLLFVLLIIRYQKNSSGFIGLILLVSALLFSRVILTGLIYPIHPVTWAIVPLALLVKALYDERYYSVLIYSVSLCFFKETFPFAIIGLSLGYISGGNFKRFLPLFAIGSFFVFFNSKIRPMMMGETIDYANSYSAVLFADPIGTVLMLFREFNYSSFFKFLFPFLIPLFLLGKNEWRKGFAFLKSPTYLALSYTLPLLAIHFVINRFHFHHASKFGAIFIAILFFSGVAKEIVKKKYLAILAIGLFFIGGMSSYSKMFLYLLRGKSSCVMNSQVLESKKMVARWSEEIDRRNENLWSTSGIALSVMKPGLKLYRSVDNSKVVKKFDYILLELNKSGDIWPYSVDQIHNIKQKCGHSASKVYVDSQYHFFAKGPFSLDCINSAL